MAINWTRSWTKVKEPVLYTTLGALLVLSVKNCSDGDKVRDADKRVQEIEANIDALGQKIGDVALYTEETYNKVFDIAIKIDSCCDCNKKTVVKPTTQRRARVVPKQTVVRDTVVVHDTVCPQKPKKSSVITNVWCYTVGKEK